MKLSEAPKPVRILLRRKGDTSVTLAMHDTTPEEVERFIKELVRPHVEPFSEAEATRVSVMQRPRKGSNDLEIRINFSFRGPSPEETKLLLVDALASTPTETSKPA